MLQHVSPFEKLQGTSPDYELCRVFSSFVFLGYAKDHHGYVCFNPHDSQIYLSRHVHIDETHSVSKEKKLFDSSILGTPPGQFISTQWLILIASIPQPDSIVPSSSKLPHNSEDSSNNNNSGLASQLPVFLKTTLISIQRNNWIPFQLLLSHHDHLNELIQ